MQLSHRFHNHFYIILLTLFPVDISARSRTTKEILRINYGESLVQNRARRMSKNDTQDIVDDADAVTAKIDQKTVDDSLTTLANDSNSRGHESDNNKKEHSKNSSNETNHSPSGGGTNHKPDPNIVEDKNKQPLDQDAAIISSEEKDGKAKPQGPLKPKSLKQYAIPDISETVAKKLCRSLRISGIRSGQSFLWSRLKNPSTSLKRSFTLVAPRFFPGCYKWRWSMCGGEIRPPLFKNCGFFSAVRIENDNCGYVNKNVRKGRFNGPQKDKAKNCPCDWPCLPFFDSIQNCRWNNVNAQIPKIAPNKVLDNNFPRKPIYLNHGRAEHLCRAEEKTKSDKSFLITSIPIPVQLSNRNSRSDNCVQWKWEPCGVRKTRSTYQGTECGEASCFKYQENDKAKEAGTKGCDVWKKIVNPENECQPFLQASSDASEEEKIPHEALSNLTRDDDELSFLDFPNGEIIKNLRKSYAAGVPVKGHEGGGEDDEVFDVEDNIRGKRHLKAAINNKKQRASLCDSPSDRNLPMCKFLMMSLGYDLYMGRPVINRPVATSGIIECNWFAEQVHCTALGQPGPSLIDPSPKQTNRTKRFAKVWRPSRSSRNMKRSGFIASMRNYRPVPVDSSRKRFSVHVNIPEENDGEAYVRHRKEIAHRSVYFDVSGQSKASEKQFAWAKARSLTSEIKPLISSSYSNTPKPNSPGDRKKKSSLDGSESDEVKIAFPENNDGDPALDKRPENNGNTVIGQTTENNGNTVIDQTTENNGNPVIDKNPENSGNTVIDQTTENNGNPVIDQKIENKEGGEKIDWSNPGEISPVQSVTDEVKIGTSTISPDEKEMVVQFDLPEFEDPAGTSNKREEKTELHNDEDTTPKTNTGGEGVKIDWANSDKGSPAASEDDRKKIANMVLIDLSNTSSSSASSGVTDEEKIKIDLQGNSGSKKQEGIDTVDVSNDTVKIDWSKGETDSARENSDDGGKIGWSSTTAKGTGGEGVDDHGKRSPEGNNKDDVKIGWSNAEAESGGGDNDNDQGTRVKKRPKKGSTTPAPKIPSENREEEPEEESEEDSDEDLLPFDKNLQIKVPRRCGIYGCFPIQTVDAKALQVLIDNEPKTNPYGGYVFCSYVSGKPVCQFKPLTTK